jgi:hypothetical protein
MRYMGTYMVLPRNVAAARRMKVRNKKPKRAMKATLLRNAAMLYIT